jgi:uncharacterized protein YraI
MIIMMSWIVRAGWTSLGLAAVVTLTASLAAHAQENPPAADTPQQAPAPSPSTPRRAAPPPDAPAPAPEGSAPKPEAAAPTASVPTRGAAKSGIAIANVNLRSGPGTDAAIVATIPGGSPVRVESCDGEWCAVTWNGRSGYAIARNLDTSGTRRVTRYQPPRPGIPPQAPLVYEQPPVFYGPPVVYAPYAYSYYYGPRRYYGPGWGWRRRGW